MIFRSFALTAIIIASCLSPLKIWGQSDTREIIPDDAQPQQRLQSDTTVEEVAKQLVDSYQEFICEIQATDGRAHQIKLLNRATAKFNALLKPILLSEDVSQVFSLMARVQLINIDASFRYIIDRHPKPEIRAAALLNFAKHCSNNYRSETAEETLLLLKKRYGTLDYTDELTFGDAAEDAIFFAKNLAIGCSAPSFVGKDADGAPLDLKDYQGKVVMLRFWGDWCPPCRAMYDFERELVQTYKNDKFALIGVNSDSLADMKAAQRRSNLIWRSVWDGGDTAGPVAMLYQVESWPTIVLIDADGVIQFRSHGLRKSQLKNAIKRCLANASRKTEAR